MLIGAAGNRVPHKDWKPDGWTPPLPSDQEITSGKSPSSIIASAECACRHIHWTAKGVGEGTLIINR